ncbi:hypothetical protein LLH00_16300 [bacterium]|nr:hypothetical protein [bacterium]
MKAAAIFLSLSLLFTAPYCRAQEEDPARREAYIQFLAGLDSLCADYQLVLEDMSVAAFVSLDQRAQRLIEHYDSLGATNLEACNSEHYPGLPPFDSDKYGDIGFEVEYYSINVVYDGLFLWQAHQLDPDSPFRKYTLYAAIYGDEGYLKYDLPNIELALQYEKEFPQGPYISDVLYVLGGFYHDKYFCLLWMKAQDNRYECSCSFDETVHPYRTLEEQIEETKALAISYWEKLARYKPQLSSEIIGCINAGQDNHSFNCPD